MKKCIKENSALKKFLFASGKITFITGLLLFTNLVSAQITATEPQLAMDFNGKTNFISVGSPSLGLTDKLSVTAWVRDGTQFHRLAMHGRI